MIRWNYLQREVSCFLPHGTSCSYWAEFSGKWGQESWVSESWRETVWTPNLKAGFRMPRQGTRAQWAKHQKKGAGVWSWEMHKSPLPILDNVCASCTVLGTWKLWSRACCRILIEATKIETDSNRSVAWNSKANTFSGGLILPLPREVCSIMKPSMLVAPMANTARLSLLIWIIKTPTPPHLARLILKRQDKEHGTVYCQAGRTPAKARW